MILRELMQKDIDITVGNTVTDQEWSLVGPVRPTPRCDEIYHDVLSLQLISVDEDYATIDLDDLEDKELELILTLINTFFVYLAGYCPEKLWDSLFIID